jgi:non-ribosomal peptide synthetase component F
VSARTTLRRLLRRLEDVRARPKGVAVEHRSTVALSHWANEFYAPEHLAGVLASTSINFDLSVFELFVPLSWGGKVILLGGAPRLWRRTPYAYVPSLQPRM